MKWDAVVADPRYHKASTEEQDSIRESWYDSNIKSDPRYTPALDPKIRKDLFGSTIKTWKPTLMEKLGQAGRTVKTGLESKLQDVVERVPLSEEAKAKEMERRKFVMRLDPVASGLEGLGVIYEQTFGRLFGGYHALLAGKNPIEGIVKPKEQPSAIESVISSKFVERMGIDAGTDPIAATWVGGLAGWALDLVGIHLIFQKLPKTIIGTGKKLIGTYTESQAKAVNGLKSALASELEAAGLPKDVARTQTDLLVAKQWAKAKVMEKTPQAISKITSIIKNNKGRLGEFLKSKVGEASAQAAAHGYTPEVLKQLPFSGARTKFGKLIESQILAKEQVPLHPASAGREALAIIAPKVPISSKIELTKPQRIASLKKAHLKFLESKNAIPPKPLAPADLDANPAVANEVLDKPQMHPPETLAKAREIKTEPIPELRPDEPAQTYDKATWYNVEYQTPTGSRETIMNGDTINAIASELKSGVIPMDSMDIPIIKLNNTFAVRGRKAQALIPEFEDAITDLMGETEVLKEQVSHVAKKFGTPFMIGQKYPAFKPVYMGVQNAIDYKAEIFFEGARVLDPNKLRALSQASKDKIVEILKLGNSSAVARYFNPEELKVKFGFNPEEIEAYRAFERTYKYGLNIEVKSRSLTADFEGATPDQQSILKENIKAQLASRGGYVSQSRHEGKWAVYSPPEAEGKQAKFFNLYTKKSEALRVQKELGEGARVYRRSQLGTDIHKNLTMADLENLVEASDVDTASSIVNDLRNTLRKRTFGSHWIKRENVPGYKWNFDNVLESAIDYLEGSANKLSRITGRRAAELAFRDNVKKMTPELRAYSRDFIDGFYNSGSIGFRAFNRLIYGYKLAFKLSWLAQNLTQPIATTYPVLAQHFKGLDIEKTFTSAYGMATRYLMHRLGKGAHGLSSDLLSKLNKCHRQGVLGDQLTRFQLGARNLSKQEFDKWIGLFGRAGESVNRTHAAICGYRSAQKIGITDKQAILEFMKEFVYKTQFAYGKQNLPLVITGAGSTKNILRTMYTFKSYVVNYLQLLNSQMPWRGAPMRQTTRTMGALLLQAGVKGLPFAALIALGYKKMTGRTMDTDVREAMIEAGIPNKVIDMSLHGAYSQLGIDASNLVGVGDAVPTYGGVAQTVGGAAVGFGAQMSKAIWHLQRGEYGRAMENASPDALRNVIRAGRYASEGVRKVSGELITTPSKRDTILQGIGFTPMDISKAYLAREAKTTLLQTVRTKSAFIHQQLAEALATKDKAKEKRIRAMLRKYNEGVAPERKIILNFQSILSNIYKRKGLETPPLKMRKRFKELERIYDVQKGERK